jgi:hypothetical protein
LEKDQQDKQKQAQIDQLKQQVETLIKEVRKSKYILTLSSMKYLFPVLAVQAAVHRSFAQANTVLSNGIAGIWATSPQKRYPAVKKQLQNIC